MKKKTRQIVVDGQTYIWGVTEISFNQVCLKVWSPEEKIPWLLVRYRFDDPWLQYGPIITATPEQREKHFQLQPMQPKRVAEIIKQALQYSQDVGDTVKRTLHFHCHLNGEIEPINDATALDDRSRSDTSD